MAGFFSVLCSRFTLIQHTVFKSELGKVASYWLGCYTIVLVGIVFFAHLMESGKKKVPRPFFNKMDPEMNLT